MKKPTRFVARQGDVLIVRIDETEKPKGDWKKAPREGGAVVLAHGEVTGHKHQIHNRNVCLLRAEGISDAVLTVGARAELQHEEHGTIVLKKGLYKVRIQREWSGALSRAVVD